MFQNLFYKTYKQIPLFWGLYNILGTGADEHFCSSEEVLVYSAYLKILPLSHQTRCGYFQIYNNVHQKVLNAVSPMNFANSIKMSVRCDHQPDQVFLYQDK